MIAFLLRNWILVPYSGATDVQLHIDCLTRIAHDPNRPAPSPPAFRGFCATLRPVVGRGQPARPRARVSAGLAARQRRQQDRRGHRPEGAWPTLARTHDPG